MFSALVALLGCGSAVDVLGCGSTVDVLGCGSAVDVLGCGSAFGVVGSGSSVTLASAIEGGPSWLSILLGTTSTGLVMLG